MTKRILSILTAMMLLIAPTTASAADFEYTPGEPYRPQVYLDGKYRFVSDLYTYEDFQYYFREDGTIALCKYLGYENGTQKETITIPAEINGKPVRRLGACLFEPPGEDPINGDPPMFSSIERILIPNGVKEIGPYAFRNCHSLISVDIPNGISALDYAFVGCTSLKAIEIPSSVRTIYQAFYDCTSLSIVKLPAYMTEIGKWAFFGCASLTEIELPIVLEKVGEAAFAGCTSLERLTLPASVKSVSVRAFDYAPQMKVTLHPDNPFITLKKDVFYSKDQATLLYARDTLTGEYRVSRKTKVIGRLAFFGIKTLRSVVLPSGLTRIGKEAFAESGLREIKLPTGLKKIGEQAFAGTPLKTLTLPKGVMVGDYAFLDAKLKQVTVNANAKLGAYAFVNCAKLKSVRLAKGVDIGYRALGFSRHFNDELYVVTEIYKDLKLYGYKGSTAEEYATRGWREIKKNRFRFIPLTSLQKAKVKNIKAVKYTKSVKKYGAKQSVKVYVKGKRLKKGRDYTLSYKNNKKRGKATVIITGINKYDGVIKRTFRIK